MRALGYPLKMTDRIPEITEARIIELGLGLQVLIFLPTSSNISLLIVIEKHSIL